MGGGSVPDWYSKSIVVYQEDSRAKEEPDYETIREVWEFLFPDYYDPSRAISKCTTPSGGTALLFSGGRVAVHTPVKDISSDSHSIWEIRVKEEDYHRYAYTPAWLEQLSDEVIANCCDFGTMVSAIMSPSAANAGVWQQVYHPGVIETVGGAEDGAQRVSEFVVAIDGVYSFLDEVVISFANGYSGMDDYGNSPRVIVDGNYRGRDVILYFFGDPPDQDDPIIKVDKDGNTLPDTSPPQES